jgi:hypothetical protein
MNYKNYMDKLYYILYIMNNKIDYNTINTNQEFNKILKNRKEKQSLILNYQSGKNVDFSSDNVRNNYSKNLLLNVDGKLIKDVKSVKDYDGYFKIKLDSKERGKYTNITATGLNRFYPLMKNPQENCIEKFTRGGENTVLNTLDNFKC